MDILLLFTIALVLAVAAFGFIIAKFMKLPFPPVLLISGILLSKAVEYTGISFDHALVAKIIVGVLLPVFVFDIFSRIHINKLDTMSWHALSTSAVLLILSAALVGIASFALFDGINNVFIAVLLGVMLVASSDFDIPLRKHTKTMGLFLYEESILSSAIMFVYVFTAVVLIRAGDLILGLKHIILGIGTGLLIGLLVFKLLRIDWKKRINHYILLFSAIACFWIASALGASPIFAVASMGYFFGNVTVKDRDQFKEFSKGIVWAFEAVLFLVIPFIIGFPFSFETILFSAIVYIMYLYAKYFSLFIATHHDFNLGEKLFLTFYSPKGTALLSALLFIYLLDIPQLEPLYPVIIVVATLSLLLSSYVAHIGHRFDKRL